MINNVGHIKHYVCPYHWQNNVMDLLCLGLVSGTNKIKRHKEMMSPQPDTGLISCIWSDGDDMAVILEDLGTWHCHDDVIKWKHFPRYWPFVRGIHRSPVNYPHKGQWRGALMLSLICTWINGWVNNRETGDLRRHRAYYDFTVMALYTITVRSNTSSVKCK